MYKGTKFLRHIQLFLVKKSYITTCFSEAYKMRKVSLLFYTFTVANQAKITIRECMDAFHKRLKRRNIKLHGYVWILEVSDNLHVHYHALIAIDRINCRGKKLPEYLKLNNVWGAICQVEFIKKSVRYYLATYFTKNKNRISGKRQYGLKLFKELILFTARAA